MSFKAEGVLFSCLLGLLVTVRVTGEPTVAQDSQLLLQSPVILQLKSVACAKETSIVECSALFDECLLLLLENSNAEEDEEKCDQPDCYWKSQKCVVLLEPHLEILKRITKDGQIADPSYYGDLAEVPDIRLGVYRNRAVVKRSSQDEDSPESSKEEFKRVPHRFGKFKRVQESLHGEFGVGERIGARICASKDVENCTGEVAKCYNLIGPESSNFGSLETEEEQECYLWIQTLVQGDEAKSGPVCDSEECETCTTLLQGNKRLKRAEIVCIFQVTDNVSMKECMILPVRKHLLTALPGYLGQLLSQKLPVCYDSNTYEGIFPCLAKYCAESYYYKRVM
ncbi:uncharacterized protein LOC135201801 [Macrobrachium nipponense]|uniref:uncharacterized protein LOC135201801 n=1 Tax=Macrobrachium nipponense TaxID=159736 RepID=UPI0030C8A297